MEYSVRLAKTFYHVLSALSSGTGNPQTQKTYLAREGGGEADLKKESARTHENAFVQKMKHFFAERNA